MLFHIYVILRERFVMGELRKVQRTPTGTFFVCLPKSWAEEHDLEKGALVALDETGEGKLLVDPKYAAEQLPRVATLAIGPYLGREIISRYLLGFDIIRIEAKERIDFDIRNVVKATMGSLIGLEIVEENYSQIVLQCLLEPSGFPPEKILRRNYTIVAGMNRDVVNSFIDGDLQRAKSVMARDDESNRLYFLLVRILRTIIQNPRLSEKLGITLIECLDYRLAANLIEAIGDASVKIAAETIELNGLKPSRELRKLLAALQAVCYDAHDQAMKAFISKDIVSAENVRNMHEKIETIFTNIERVAKEQPVEVMPQILATASFLRRIYEHSVDLADLVV
ncbi:phosphate uptake regulator PhoU [Candidatus Bathyarchaeota archaeon]|nr:phosphate uptake regulator PhoU [Candidatus Bathyarchaeota archaeon]